MTDENSSALKDVEADLVAYARNKPQVLKVWLFGSRVSGEYRPDSDLDVAMELSRSAMPADWCPFSTWASEHNVFQDEIQPLIPHVLHHVHFYCGQHMQESLKKAICAGRLIFSRRSVYKGDTLSALEQQARYRYLMKDERLTERAKQAASVLKAIDSVVSALKTVPSFTGKARLIDKVRKVQTRAHNLRFDLERDIEREQRGL